MDKHTLDYVKSLTPEQFKYQILHGTFADNLLAKTKPKADLSSIFEFISK